MATKRRTPKTTARRRLRSPAPRTRNRRVGEGDAGKRTRAPLSPEAKRVRNRTILALGLLGLINAYVFVWRDDGSLSSLGELGPTAIGARANPLPALADPPEVACTGDPVRIFEGLDDLIRLEASLSGGYTLRLALLELGISATEIDRIEASVRSKVDLSLLGGSGAPLRLAVDRTGDVQALEIELSEGHVLQACRTPEAAEPFAVRNLQHPLRSDVVVVSLELGADADLARAVQAAEEAPELASLIARALAYDVDFMTEARPGDALQVMVEKRWLGRRFHRYGAVLALRFAGNATRASYYWYKPEGKLAGFFDDEGKPMRRALMRSPIGYFPVDPEARGMLPPSMEVIEGRLGAVYRVPEGAPVLALADGTIRQADETLEEGHFVDLEIEGGLVIRYAHMLRTIGDQKPGRRVAQGELLGLAGHSGQTPNDRLRLELWKDEGGVMKTVDPMRPTGDGPLRPQPIGSAVPKGQMERFEADIEARRKALALAE